MVRKVGRFEKSGVKKLQRSISKGNENWFKKSGSLRNRDSTVVEVIRFASLVTEVKLTSVYSYACAQCHGLGQATLNKFSLSVK